MTYLLALKCSDGPWVFRVKIHEQALRRACLEKGIPDDFENPVIQYTGSWQDRVHDSANMHAELLARHDGYQGLWVTQAPEPMIPIEDVEMPDADIHQNGYSIKLVSRPT